MTAVTELGTSSQAGRMPFYVHDMSEVSAEDDSPLAANTPTTGVSGHSRVIGCGNRVLEIIEKHKRDIQSRMANRADTFRGILEKELEGRNIRKHGRSHSLSKDHQSLHDPDSSLLYHPRVRRDTATAGPPPTSVPKESEVPPQLPSSSAPKKVRHSAEAKIINLQEGRPKPKPVESNLPLISSEEYLDLPAASKGYSPSPGTSKPEKKDINPSAEQKPTKKGSLKTHKKDSIDGSKRVTLLSKYFTPLKDNKRLQPPTSAPYVAYQKDCTWEEYHDPCFEGYNANSKSDTVAYRRDQRDNYPPAFPVSQEEIRKSLRPTHTQKHRSFDMDDESAFNFGYNDSRSRTRDIYQDGSSRSTSSDDEDDFSQVRSNPTTNSTTASKSQESSTTTTAAMTTWGRVLDSIWDRTWEFMLLLAVIILVLGLCVVSMDHNNFWKIFTTQEEEKIKPGWFKPKYKGPVM